MSSIRSNSIGDVQGENLYDFQQKENEAIILETLLSVPLKIPRQVSHLFQKNDDLSQMKQRVRLKALLFIRMLLKDIRFKSQMKKFAINASQMDNIKSIKGFDSCQKDIVKFTVVLKHHQVADCKNFLAKIFTKMIFGEDYQY